jgi:hypothetical protein
MSSRLQALENKFSTYVPVDTQTGTFSKTINNHSTASQTIIFDPVFTNVPIVNAEYTNSIGASHADDISINVSDITRYSCVITIENDSTANFTFNMVWTAIADA